MEPQVLSEQLKREARRVAAAFGMQEWTHYYAIPIWHCSGRSGQKRFDWQLSEQQLKLTVLSIAEKGRRKTLAYFLPNLGMTSGDNDVLLARGLYYLGIEPEEKTIRLPTLTAHEKMELRLSMPREFWPKTWLDEEASQQKGKP